MWGGKKDNRQRIIGLAASVYRTAKHEVGRVIKTGEYKPECGVFIAPDNNGDRTITRAAVAQSVERVLGKDEVKGPNPLSSFLSADARPCGTEKASTGLL
jgi:hypothetical protein